MMTAAKKGSIECLLRLRKGTQWGEIHSDTAFLSLKSIISQIRWYVLAVDFFETLLITNELFVLLL